MIISPKDGTKYPMPPHLKEEYGSEYIVADGYIFIPLSEGDGKVFKHCADTNPIHTFHFTGKHELLNDTVDDITFLSIDYLIMRSLMHGLNKASQYKQLKEELLKEKDEQSIQES